MKPFEEELRRALGRQQAPEDFSARLFERIAEQERQTKGKTARNAWWRFSRAPLWQWALALLLIVGCAGAMYRERMRVERGEAAKDQLLLAMRITSQQLRVAQTRLREVERPGKVMQ